MQIAWSSCRCNTYKSSVFTPLPCSFSYVVHNCVDHDLVRHWFDRRDLLHQRTCATKPILTGWTIDLDGTRFSNGMQTLWMLKSKATRMNTLVLYEIAWSWSWMRRGSKLFHCCQTLVASKSLAEQVELLTNANSSWRHVHGFTLLLSLPFVS